jgi:hypothetical protein
MRGRRRTGTFEFEGNNVTLNVESDLPVEVNGVAAKSPLSVAIEAGEIYPEHL